MLVYQKVRLPTLEQYKTLGRWTYNCELAFHQVKTGGMANKGNKKFAVTLTLTVPVADPTYPLTGSNPCLGLEFLTVEDNTPQNPETLIAERVASAFVHPEVGIQWDTPYGKKKTM